MIGPQISKIWQSKIKKCFAIQAYLPIVKLQNTIASLQNLKIAIDNDIANSFTKGHKLTISGNKKSLRNHRQLSF